MQISLNNFRTEFHDRLLNLLWRQWTALGVAGQVAPWEHTVLDPEALLLITCTVARRDPRLFDAMLDWLQVHGRYLNVQRLQRMLKENPFSGSVIFAAVADTTSTTERVAKWARSAKPTASTSSPQDSLFRMEDGTPLPLLHKPDQIFLAHGLLRDGYEPRGVAHSFRPELTANLLLRLRAFSGVNARCEILAYLLLNRSGTPRAMARACGYYPATVTKLLSEMGDSGFVSSRLEGRHRHYTLIPDAWHTLLLGIDRPVWIVWPALFSALEQVWHFLQMPDSASPSSLAQASALRRILMSSALENLTASNLPTSFGDIQPYSGETLIPFFITQMRETLASIEALA